MTVEEFAEIHNSIHRENGCYSELRRKHGLTQRECNIFYLQAKRKGFQLPKLSRNATTDNEVRFKEVYQVALETGQDKRWIAEQLGKTPIAVARSYARYGLTPINKAQRAKTEEEIQRDEIRRFINALKTVAQNDGTLQELADKLSMSRAEVIKKYAELNTTHGPLPTLKKKQAD